MDRYPQRDSNPRHLIENQAVLPVDDGDIVAAAGFEPATGNYPKGSWGLRQPDHREIAGVGVEPTESSL